MTGSPIISVRGEVTREVDPEIAQFAVTVTARDRDRARTLSRLTARVDALRTLLDGYARAVERRETSGLYVRPEAGRRGERVTGYTGTVTTTVTVADFAVLGELMLRLADEDQTSIAGPWWSLRPSSPVHAQARRAAIDEAVGRAREYAAALGARIAALVELSDAGLSRPPEPVPVQLSRMMRFGAPAGAPAPPGLDLEPARQTVYAQVTARFAITEPAGLTEPAD